jgi:hypothetical protein
MSNRDPFSWGAILLAVLGGADTIRVGVRTLRGRAPSRRSLVYAQWLSIVNFWYLIRARPLQDRMTSSQLRIAGILMVAMGALLLVLGIAYTWLLVTG